MSRKFKKNIQAKVLPITTMLLLVIAGLSAVFIILPSDDVIVSAATVDQFSYYKEITLNSSQVPSTLTNFPVCINLSSDADLASKALDSGWDIAFFDGTGAGASQYNHEIELFNGTTGRLVAWVNVTSLAHDADTSIYMYYGDADIGSSAENVVGTWHSNYLFVTHMADASGGVVDSTSNNNDFTEYGDPTYRQLSDTTGYEITFDGTGDYFSISDNAVWDRIASNDEISVFGVANANDEYVYPVIQQHAERDGALDSSWMFRTDLRVEQTHMTNLIYPHDNVGGDPSITLYTTLTTPKYKDFIFYTSVFNENMTCRAENITTKSSVTIIGPSSIDVQIGAYSNSNYDYDGNISEIRVASPSFSKDYMDTFYNNIINASDEQFFTVGTEQSGTSGTYEISGLDTNTQFTFSGEAGTMVWANDTSDGTNGETLAIHTNLSGTTENCTDIFLDFNTWIDADLDEETLNITVANTTGDFAGNMYQVPNGGNVTINNSVWAAQAWCQGTNPFDTNNSIDKVNRTFYVRVRQSIPSGKSTGTYEVTSASSTVNILWKVIT